MTAQLLNMTRADYDRRGEVNFSTLKILGTKSPAHYHASLLAPVSEDTDARQRGRAVHCAVLEPTRFRSDFVTFTGAKRAGKAWEAFEKDNVGKEMLTRSMADHALAMAKAASAVPAARPYLSGGKSEATLLWSFARETLGGLAGYEMECKSRLDFIANCGALVDLKTTRDASPSGFGREVARYNYHVQAAFYQDAYLAVTGKRLPYVFVALEAAWPHVGAVYRVTDRAFQLGRETYVDWMDRLHTCQQSNSWPGYGEGEMDVELPAWLDPDDDESDDLSGLITTEAA